MTARKMTPQPKKKVRQIPGERDPRYHKLTFGQYRGVFLKDVPSDYLRWICSTFEDQGRVQFFQRELQRRTREKGKV